MITINKIDSSFTVKNHTGCGAHNPYHYGELDGNGMGNDVGGVNVHADGDNENPFYVLPHAKEEYEVWNYGKYQNGDGVGEGY